LRNEFLDLRFGHAGSEAPVRAEATRKNEEGVRVGRLPRDEARDTAREEAGGGQGRFKTSRTSRQARFANGQAGRKACGPYAESGRARENAKRRPAPIPTQAPPLRRAADLSFALNTLHQVALLATDLDRSVAFYRDVLGLHYMDRYDPPGLAFFNLGSGVRLILSATSSKATLYFLVDDIESAFRVLAQRGVSFLHKPSMIHRDDEGRLGKKGIEEWMAFFKDPSDNVLALVARR
jgi:methylmalonyl-CoA/ethylmalonyl-CoA epimerase